MRPEADHMLMGLAAHLGGVIAPRLEETYAGGSISTIALAILFAAQEYDRGAELRLRENDALRELFSDLADRVGDELAHRLRTAARTNDASLRISSLNASNAALKTVLVEVQTHMEQSDEPWAKDANRRVWALLDEFTQARQLVIPPPAEG